MKRVFGIDENQWCLRSAILRKTRRKINERQAEERIWHRDRHRHRL